MTHEEAEVYLATHPLVKPRLATLRKAAELNKDFCNPHIVGGYLRNVLLGVAPRDCDVVFEGHMLDQPGILEAVQEAERLLDIEPFSDWEFENSKATGFSGDIIADNIGEYTYHTDYLTRLMMNTNAELIVVDPKTLEHIEKRIYEIYLPGVEMWATHRGNGRSYASCIAGDLIRALYFAHSINVSLSRHVEFLLKHYDEIFSGLSPDDQASRIKFWRKKTGGNPSYKRILDRYNITVLPIDD
jgi:hypothetical protein